MIQIPYYDKERCLLIVTLTSNYHRLYENMCHECFHLKTEFSHYLAQTRMFEQTTETEELAQRNNKSTVKLH
jgi:hypothetical protein